jgi:hypothetical protein
MLYGLRRRCWLESVLGSLTGCLTIVTLFAHDWIEGVLGMDPDQGNGSVEWLLVVAFLASIIILAVAARMEWHRARLPVMREDACDFRRICSE